MLHLPRPSRAIIATVAIACFGVGAASAQGAYTVDKHIATAQAREAATLYEQHRLALETSLSEADAVADQAAGTGDDAVARAADELEDAATSAQATAEQADQAAASATGTADAHPSDVTLAAPDEVVTNVPDADLPQIDEGPASETSRDIDAAGEDDAATAAGTDAGTGSDASPDDATAHGTAADNTTADAPQESAGEDAASQSSTPLSDAMTAATEEPSASTGDVSVTEDVAEAAFSNPADARAATEALTEAAAELKAATATVDAERDAVADATEQALLAQAQADYGDDVAAAQAQVAHADDLVALVDDHVSDASTLSNYTAARANLTSLTTSALSASDSKAAQARLDAIADATTALEDALTDVRASNEEWIDEENARIDAENDAAEDAYDKELAEAKAAHVEANRAAVAARQNGWSGQPTGVSGSNGRLSSGSLCAVDFAPGQYLQCDAADAIEDADDAYFAQTGRHLVMTDSYRSYSLQVTTRARKPATAAVPGTSNHGWGMAVDLDPASASWLTANGSDFGWVHPAWARSGGSKPESWHLEYVATEVGSFTAPEAPIKAKHVTSVFADEAASSEK